MARKKAEIALQQELETQEEWEEYLAKEGLSVIDIYQEWAGPCKSMVSILKRLKNELGDDLLRFAVAKTDSIDALERYRGKCQPCFMLYAGGCLVAIIRGANSPLLLRTITEQLAHEHKVIDGAAERKEIKDPLLADLEKEKAALDEEENEKGEEIEQEVTVCIIKPDAIAAGKKDEILEQLAERGIEVLTDEERLLTEEEVKEFYASHAEEDYFEDLVKFMSSGPSHVLVLSKGDAGIIDEFRDLLGPKDVDEAKEVAPDSLRAKYGSEKLTNALHASDSQDRAHAELAFFFPNFSKPTRTVVKPTKEKKKKGKKQKAPKIERTLALIRPDAVANHKEEILAKVKEAGFEVALQKEVQLTKEQAEEFYKEHRGEEYFEELTTKMSCGPLLALGLARAEAVTSWRDMLGPKEVPVAKTEAPESLRAQYSVDEDLINPLHGSDSATKAEEELEFFFPVQQTMAVVKPDAYQTKEDIMNKIREAGFRIAARQETELNNEIVEALYSEHKDKDYFNDLSDHMTSGPTLFMVLSRHDAVEGWRSMMGNTDPEKAKEENPESIRAAFGKDIKSNAVHGASTEDEAKAEVKLIFGEIEFNKDGTVKGEETGLENETMEEEAEDEDEDDEEEEDEDKASGDEGGAEAGEEAKEEAAEQEEILSRPSSTQSLHPATPKAQEEKISPREDEDDFYEDDEFNEGLSLSVVCMSLCGHGFQPKKNLNLNLTKLAQNVCIPSQSQHAYRVSYPDFLRFCSKFHLMNHPPPLVHLTIPSLQKSRQSRWLLSLTPRLNRSHWTMQRERKHTVTRRHRRTALGPPQLVQLMDPGLILARVPEVLKVLEVSKVSGPRLKQAFIQKQETMMKVILRRRMKEWKRRLLSQMRLLRRCTPLSQVCYLKVHLGVCIPDPKPASDQRSNRHYLSPQIKVKHCVLEWHVIFDRFLRGKSFVQSRKSSLY
ncbi:thioredoxin domain-containing protein 3 homolog isoform X10 [Lineus longissimus]|uniref:thioredoxin domain-containing protein 3 homolog isoform X10 n=1 Tax=Lineus longissimus TaxID=88925 RepID=UPI00315D1117